MRGAATPAPLAQACQEHSSVLDSYSKHRRYNTAICKNLAMDAEAISLAQAIGNCSLRLGIEMEFEEGQAPKTKLRSAGFCNRRLCPFCEWRRTKGWRRRMFTGLPSFHEDFPSHRPVFLTLTQKSVPLTELRSTIQDMHKAWNRMKQCSFFPTPFWFRRTEVTVKPPKPPLRPCDEVGRPEAMAHPHIHVLLLVPAGYFSHGYVKKSEWANQWQMAGRYDYRPVVDVRACRARGGDVEPRGTAKEATLEAAKYATKAVDLIALGQELGEFSRQIHGLRLTGVSNSLKPYVSAGDISEEEMLDGGDALPVEGIQGIAQWFEDMDEYLFVELNA